MTTTTIPRPSARTAVAGLVALAIVLILAVTIAVSGMAGTGPAAPEVAPVPGVQPVPAVPGWADLLPDDDRAGLFTRSEPNRCSASSTVRTPC
jgi:hypothetical protein